MNLNPAHIHLILNHIPILGTMIFAPLVLIWGLVRHSRDITQSRAPVGDYPRTHHHPDLLERRAGRGTDREAGLVL
jgi:hypothetical protein